MQLIMDSEIICDWLGDRDPFQAVAAIDGTVVRNKEGRKTQRFEINGEGYYVKHHHGIGWQEVTKNLAQLRLPITGAANEWLAINRLHELGVDTLTAVAYGSRGLNPAQQESFLITEQLSQTVSVAKLTAPWPSHPPTPTFRRALIEKIATIARTLHQNGINHRDLYLCHFLFDRSTGLTPLQHLSVTEAEKIRLFVVDLHRAQIRSKVPFRWQVKDLGSILFSSLDIGLTGRDILRFMRVYFDKPLRDILKDEAKLLKACQKRAEKLYYRDFGEWAVIPKLP